MKTSELRKHRTPLLHLYPGQSEPQDAYVEVRPHEASSENDAGANALSRWHVNAATVDALVASGEADEVA